MKRKLSVLALGAALTMNVVMAGHAWAQTALTDGQVTKVDASAGKITIKHGPMKNFDMEDGMTMAYRVQDSAMLTEVKARDKVKFDAEHVNGQFIVTKIQKVK